MKVFLLSLLSIFITYSIQAQSCKMYDMKVDLSDCNVHGQIFATISFQYQNTSDSFRLVGSGRNYGSFSYHQLPVTIGPLDADCETHYEFVAIDKEYSDCKTFSDAGKFCCDDDCDIEIIDVEVDTCDGLNYGLSFNLLSNDPDQIFDVYHNNEFLKTIHYNGQPIHLNHLTSSIGASYNELKICSKNNPECCEDMDIPNPCICNIYNVQSQIIDCNEQDSTFSLRIFFNHNMTSDSFTVGGNRTTYGTFAYRDLPITISGLHFSDSIEYEFIIVDNQDVLCFHAIELDKIQNCNYTCEIEKPSLLLSDCNDNGEVYAYISFESSNVSVDGFTIRGNGRIYGSFNYGEDNYKVGPLDADCKTIYEFGIKDNSIDHCSNFAVPDAPICCKDTCTISDLDIEETCHNGTLQKLTIEDFDYSAGFSGNFVLIVNGQRKGIFALHDLPIDIPANEFKNKTVKIIIFDAAKESCHLVHNYTIKCDLETCYFDDFSIIDKECNGDGAVFLKFKFKHRNTGSKGFGLVIKGKPRVYTYEYKDDNGSYTLAVPGDCTTKYGIEIFDLNHPDCGISYQFDEPLCCEHYQCGFINMQLSHTECEDGSYSLIVNLDPLNNSSQFELRHNGQLYGRFNYTELPIVISGLTESFNEINIKDAFSTHCTSYILKHIGPECISSTDSYTDGNLVRLKQTSQSLYVVTDNRVDIDHARLLDIQGKTWLILNDISEETPINIQQLPAGMYIIQLSIEGEIINKKFIKH
ncbi:MAG: T9SS type A sorting domain-containing protein [Saprospiraceae bacterium]|nr:T9SS type A sorting domain-containing protein [Saprospiraceae bacterium]MCZ2337308.1 T9SS type A sorting domain-containing protein [Chitinophagales bacterium]